MDFQILNDSFKNLPMIVFRSMHEFANIMRRKK